MSFGYSWCVFVIVKMHVINQLIKKRISGYWNLIANLLYLYVKCWMFIASLSKVDLKLSTMKVLISDFSVTFNIYCFAWPFGMHTHPPISTLWNSYSDTHIHHTLRHTCPAGLWSLVTVMSIFLNTVQTGEKPRPSALLSEPVHHCHSGSVVQNSSFLSRWSLPDWTWSV